MLSGGTAYRLNLDLIKPSTPSSWTSSNYSYSSSSPSSNSSVSARKARTPRKRPNQTYDEAASILSAASPKLFPAKPFKYTKSFDQKKIPFLFEPPDLLLPIERIGASPGRPSFCFGTKNNLHLCQENSSGGGGAWDEWDREYLSILDEGMEEGLDSIMGNRSMEDNEGNSDFSGSAQLPNACDPVVVGLEFGNGMRNELREMRDVDGGGDWWRFPIVNLADITRKIAEIPVEKKKRKKKNENSDEASGEEAICQTRGRLNLKLNYEDVLRAWSDRGLPFSGEGARARLAQIDLFSENRLSYNEKQHSHLFSKRIKHQVKKSEANQRPRLKGRFVRPPNSPSMVDRT